MSGIVGIIAFLTVLRISLILSFAGSQGDVVRLYRLMWGIEGVRDTTCFPGRVLYFLIGPIYKIKAL